MFHITTIALTFIITATPPNSHKLQYSINLFHLTLQYKVFIKRYMTEL